MTVQKCIMINILTDFVFVCQKIFIKATGLFCRLSG
jgi:hypothetical protein